MAKILDQKNSSIIIEDVQASIFEVFLTYLYTGEISFAHKSPQSLKQLAQVAEKMNEPHLKSLCHFRLLWSLDEESLIDIMNYAKSCCDPDLLQACTMVEQQKYFHHGLDSLTPLSTHGFPVLKRVLRQKRPLVEDQKKEKPVWMLDDELEVDKCANAYV